MSKETLTRFVKNECANFVGYYQHCIDGRPCKVLTGKRCGYFERAVLGSPDYKYRLPTYDYQKLFAQYADQTGTQTRRVKVRRCECGTPLRLRQKYCANCSKRRRKTTQKEQQRKFRKTQRLSVIQLTETAP